MAVATGAAELPRRDEKMGHVFGCPAIGGGSRPSPTPALAAADGAPSSGSADRWVEKARQTTPSGKTNVYLALSDPTPADSTTGVMVESTPAGWVVYGIC